jgi:hypothetical protein
MMRNAVKHKLHGIPARVSTYIVVAVKPCDTRVFCMFRKRKSV